LKEPGAPKTTFFITTTPILNNNHPKFQNQIDTRQSGFELKPTTTKHKTCGDIVGSIETKPPPFEKTNDTITSEGIVKTAPQEKHR